MPPKKEKKYIYKVRDIRTGKFMSKTGSFSKDGFSFETMVRLRQNLEGRFRINSNFINDVDVNFYDIVKLEVVEVKHVALADLFRIKYYKFYQGERLPHGIIPRKDAIEETKTFSK